MPDLGLSGGAMPNGQVLDSSGGNTTTTTNNTTTTTPGPYNTPIPGVAQYSQLIAAAQNFYKQSVATLNLQRQNLLQQYGYVGKIDPATGLISHMGVDPYNPYGLYQQTLRGAGQQMGAAQQSDVARGIGINSGLARQGQEQLQYGFGQATNTLANNLQQSLLGLQTQQIQDQYQEQNSIVQAQLAALNQAITMMLSGQNIDPAQLPNIGSLLGGTS